MLFRCSRLAAALISLALVSACTTEGQGQPRPASSASSDAPPDTSQTAEKLPFAGAPAVDDPLDTSSYEREPCRVLTPGQARLLNLPETGAVNDKVALGIGCDWLNRETRGEVSINFPVDDPRGLSAEYDADSRGKWEYFEELPEIDGYPAVTRAGTDDRDLGFCIVVVGVADDMAFESIVQLSQGNVGQKDPCEVSVQVAGMALQTMKGA
jgi:hypothetical protein